MHLTVTRSLLVVLLERGRLNARYDCVFLTVTPRSYGKFQISAMDKIKTSECIEIKFYTVDYVHEISPETKFDYNGFREHFWGIREIYVKYFCGFSKPYWRSDFLTQFDTVM